MQTAGLTIVTSDLDHDKEGSIPSFIESLTICRIQEQWLC